MTSTGDNLPLHNHPAPHRELVRRYRQYTAQQNFRVSVVVGALLLAGAFYLNFLAIHIATNNASSSVTDIILSNIPVFEVDGLFVYGTLVVGLWSALLVFAHPKRIPFVFHALALFVVIRSVFTMLTHLGPPEVQYMTDFGATITRSFFGADQFFSAHTGMPFLGALVFWHEKYIRYSMLAASAFFAVIVLLGHIHYTIDVVAAFFITYAIYHIALWLFPKDYAMFRGEDEFSPTDEK
ncbi:MAG: phosphatase PAP2-related protein [Patescibacteria group bacterium]